LAKLAEAGPAVLVAHMQRDEEEQLVKLGASESTARAGNTRRSAISCTLSAKAASVG
jgi:hypothetical protein